MFFCDLLIFLPEIIQEKQQLQMNDETNQTKSDNQIKFA